VTDPVVGCRIEAGESPTDVARALLREHQNVIFNGNGYDPTWPDTAVEKGIWRIDSVPYKAPRSTLGSAVY
jgi:glutamine synthetase